MCLHPFDPLRGSCKHAFLILHVRHLFLGSCSLYSIWNHWWPL